MARPTKNDSMVTTLSTETMEQRFTRLQKEVRHYAKTIGNTDFDKVEYDPLLEMAKLAVNPGTPTDIRVRCHSEVAAYRYPKLKSMEIALPAGSEGKITIEITHFGAENRTGGRSNEKKVVRDVEPDYTKLPPQ